MADPAGNQDPQPAPVTGCLLQIVWSIVGPGLVLIAGALSIFEHRPIGSPQDWFLLGAVVASIASRFLDPSRPGEARAGGDAPPGPWKYAAWIAGAGVLAFVIAHVVAPYVF